MSNFEEFEEFKFLTINTPNLWKQGKVSEGNLEFLDTIDNGHYSNTGGINLSGFSELYAQNHSRFLLILLLI